LREGAPVGYSRDNSTEKLKRKRYTQAGLFSTQKETLSKEENNYSARANRLGEN
jgi:hypothetical protein